VESITEAGRDLLAKKCKLSTSEITERLLHAKERVRFVQANLLDSQCDDPDEVEKWREGLQQHGVWANKPVPLFPLSRIARLHAAMGPSRRFCLGTRP
jgi:anaerobic magnesium-protoporphyrin IX monomethyl ester cyclase